MFDKHMNDYYKLRISLADICKSEKVNQSTFYRYLSKNELKTRRGYYGLMNLGDKELDTRMKDRYAGIVKRCNNKRYSGGYYEGLEYLPIYDWVEFCNDNKSKLLEMWNQYLNHDKDLKYAISVDRLDNGKGYFEGNIQFVIQGCNAWKRNIRPIKVEHDNQERFFTSCEEASGYYDVSRQHLGVLLRGDYASKRFTVTHSTTEKVLNENGIETIEDYYKMFIL